MTKGRDITVTGPRGTLNKNFSHLSLDLTHKTGGTNSNGQAVGGSIRVDMWFGTKKQIACIRTICAAIENMVREGGGRVGVQGLCTRGGSQPTVETIYLAVEG